VREIVSPHYAGDTIQVVVLRGEERLPHDVTLVEKLEPYSVPFLGFLPMRDPLSADEPLVVRYVYPDSPASKAGLKVGDIVLGLGEEPIADRAALAEKLIPIQPQAQVTLQIRRNEQTKALTLSAGTLPEAIPDSLPVARKTVPALAEAGRPNVGRFDQQVPEYDNQALVYVPQSYDAGVKYGVVIHLSADGAYDAAELISLYQPLCDAHDLILVAPQTVPPADATARRRWNPNQDVPYIGKLLTLLDASYNLDRTRIAVHGYQGGGNLGFLLAAQNREWIRAVAAVEALPLQRPPENEPPHRLAFYLAAAGKTSASMRDQVLQRLREMKYPVTLRELGDEPRPLNAGELAALVRWIDTLDRL
jgi:hypothetical protein